MEESGPGAESTGETLHLLSRDELEAEIRDRTAYLENLMDTMADVLLKLEPDGRISMANAAITDILGYDEDAVIDKPIEFLVASTDDDDQLSDMISRGEFTNRLLTRGKLTDVEVYFETADGETVPMSLSASVMTDDGDLSGIVCVAKDISERKAAQERAEFLHSLLRHDMGNQLQIAYGRLQLALDIGPENDQIAEFVADAKHSTEEAMELIETVRTLQQLECEEDRRRVDLGSTLHEALDRHTDLADEHDVELERAFDDPPSVAAGSLLKELFANLIENAIVHSGGDLVRVSTDDTIGVGTGDGVSTGTGDDGQIVVSVEDDGRGVPDDRKNDILEKGVSGPESSGSGLGMHLAASIADAYDGGLTVGDSELGGARFDVTLERALD